MRPLSKNDPDELDRFKREIDLVAYAKSLGYCVDHKESSPRAAPTRWILRRQADDAKLLVQLGRKCWVFRDLRGDAWGTIVDFVQHERQLPAGAGLGDIRKHLREYVDGPGRSAPRVFAPAETAPRLDRATIAERWNAATDHEPSRYLCGRGISRETLYHPRFRDTWRVDGRGNVLFAHHDGGGLCGFEIKNHGFTSFATGGKKGIWRSHAQPSDTTLVITESAIDALSHHQLQGEAGARYLSTSGNLSGAQRALIARAMADMPAANTTVLAFDNDRGGERLADDIRRLARTNEVIRQVPAKGKDWNDCLQGQLKDRDVDR